MVAPPAVAATDTSATHNVAGTESNERNMRVVEWLVAGAALLATLLLAIPK